MIYFNYVEPTQAAHLRMISKKMEPHKMLKKFLGNNLSICLFVLHIYKLTQPYTSLRHYVCNNKVY
jgi:hypothetical protein